MPSRAMEPADAHSRAFSEVFRAHMGRQRLSGKVLAAKAGVSQNYLAKRLRDEVSFNVNDIEILAKALQLPLTNLTAEVAATVERMNQKAAGPASDAP